MGSFLVLFALLAAVVLLALGIRRGTELFLVTMTAGSVRLVRGRCPSRLLDELGDVAKLEQLDSVTVRVLSSGGRPRVVAHGTLSEGQLQQLRNVVGRFQVAQIRRGNKRA